MATIHPTIQAVIFDFDDTLVGTMKAKWAQHKHIAQTYYYKQLSDEELRMHWGKPLTTLLTILYETNNLEQALVYNTTYRKHFPKLLFEGTLDTLHALHTAGKQLGIVTSTTRANLHHDFETLGIPQHLFHYLQTEEDTSHHKPDPKVFEPTISWLSQQHIQPHEVLYVGDHLNDMAAAKGAGFAFIGVGTGLISVPEFETHNVQAITNLPLLIQ